MKTDTIQDAITEAERFLKTAKRLQAMTEKRTHFHSKEPHFYMPPKESSATKRASMDLTRALSAMRKS